MTMSLHYEYVIIMFNGCGFYWNIKFYVFCYAYLFSIFFFIEWNVFLFLVWKIHFLLSISLCVIVVARRSDQTIFEISSDLIMLIIKLGNKKVDTLRIGMQIYFLSNENYFIKSARRTTYILPFKEQAHSYANINTTNNW